MIRRLALLVAFASFLSACASRPPECRQIRSERWPVQHSWLLERVEPGALQPATPASLELLAHYREGDEIFSYLAPGSRQGLPVNPGQRGYVLLRGCEAVYVIPSMAY